MYILCDENNKVVVNHTINDITNAKKMASDYKKLFPKHEINIYELKEII